MDRLIPILRWAAAGWLLIGPFAATAQNTQQRGAENGTTTNVPGTLPDLHLVAPLANGQWTMPAGDYGNLRYSPLSQINTGNVQNLHVVANMTSGIPHEGGPLVVGNTMYMVTPFPNNLIAYDLSEPGFPQKWIFRPYPNSTAVGIACCDVVNRGASFGDGKIVYNTLDDHTVAVDANTGKQVWKTQVGDVHFGETTTMAPVIVKNMVYVGDSGGELGVRGRLTALDLKTGKIMWRAFSTGPDLDVRIGADFKPFYAKDRGKDLGVKTWNPDQWKLGGVVTQPLDLMLVVRGERTSVNGSRWT